ncbi:hypothetical protein [Streptomyces sp. NPDC098781]|uniref:hypothetical protein n=1 Tax=Streptomyces sp. NPDC098781 TaxID=3366097 RepID=UPI00381C5DDF
MKIPLRKKTMMAGAALVAAVSLATATPANAENRHSILIDVEATWFEADYCLVSDLTAQCSGKKGWSSEFRLSVPYMNRVWLDINIWTGADRKGIELKGKRYLRVQGDLGRVQVCGWKSIASHGAGNIGVALHGNTSCDF